jgi:hypothetical protein
VDGLIRGIGIDLAGAVAVGRCPDVAEQSGQLRLVVGADLFMRGAPFGFAPRCDGTALQPDRPRAWAHQPYRAGSRAAVPGALASATLEPGTSARSALRPAYPR